MQITMRGVVYDKLDEASLITGLKKYTIINLAFYNGLKSIVSGYRCIPKEEPKGSQCTRRITVSEQMKKCVQKLADESKYSQRVIIETFIELECDRLIKLFKKYNKEDDEEEELGSFNIRVTLPKELEDKIRGNAYTMGITDNQYFSYLLLQGFSFHEENYAPLTRDKDYNLAQEVMNLGIDPLKAYTLTNFLAAYYFKDKELDMDKFLSEWIEINNSKMKEQKQKRE